MQKTVIAKVTETEFETEDGRVYPHPIPFVKGEVPTVAEFQAHYDRCQALFTQQTEDEPDVG